MSADTVWVSGGCLCGKVAYELSLPFQIFRYCHCRRCRKATGTAHAANIFVSPAQLRWLSGEDATVRYDLPEAERFATCFCTTCGSPVPRLIGDGSRVLVPAGSLDDDPGALPDCSIFWESRAPWYRETQELPKHSEYPD